MAKKPIPFDFILDELASMDLHTKPMFGAYGVYVGEKIMMILRKKEDGSLDTGVWLGIPDEFILEMKKRFPMLKDLQLFGTAPTAWQVLRETDPDFEEMAFQICSLIKKHDPMIGRIPKARKLKGKTAKARVKKKKLPTKKKTTRR